MSRSQLFCLTVLVTAFASQVVCFLDAESLAVRQNLHSAFSRSNKLPRKRKSSTKITAWTAGHVVREAGADARGECHWDAGSAQCLPTLAAMSKILDQSDHEFGHFFAQLAVCDMVTDETSCSAKEQCHWGPSGCQLIQSPTARGDSPCYKASPATVDQFFASQKCAAYETQLPCMNDPDCRWEQDELTCEADGWKFFTGISEQDFSDAVEPVTAYKAAQLVEAFVKTFDTQDPEFDWMDVIHWDAPQTPCPDWSDPLVCSFVDGLFLNIGIGFYCGAKYNSVQQLNECAQDDDLCYFQLDAFACRALPETFAEGSIKGLMNILSVIKDDGDREIFRRSLECESIQKEDQCTGECVWDSFDGEEACTLSGRWITSWLTDAGKDTPGDSGCIYTSALASHECLDISDPERCVSNPDCTVRLDSDCTVSTRVFLETAIKQDETTWVPYDALKQTCSDYSTKSTCQPSSRFTVPVFT